MALQFTANPSSRASLAFAGNRASMMSVIAGPQGAAATIEVGDVTTLAAGSPATVTNVGTSSAAIFDFGIPQGEDGDGGGGGGSGDVEGPASAVNERIAVFDGTTGKLIKDGGSTIAVLATLASPTFTGTPAAPTAAAATNTTQLATTAHVFAERTNTATLTNKTLTAPVVNSPTGIVKGDVGLGSVDNTSDAGKPVSTATQTALDLKANLASPTLTGTPAAPTAAAATNTTQIATTAHVFAERTNSATLTNKTLTSPVVNSPTGIVKGDVGLGNVDNTSDANKPVSTATQTALDLKVATSRQVISGDGLTGGGDLSADRTLAVGAGTGITVNANDVAVSTDGVSNTLLANMPAWSIKLRNAGTTGDPSDAALADLTAEATPSAGDFVLGFLSSGEIRKIDIDDLPGGGGSGIASVVEDTSPQLGGDLDLNGHVITGLSSADSPQFTAVNIGAATDTTVTRVSAGVIAVEGATIYAQGGALGTPASGTLTNCTGLPVAGITSSTATALGVGSIELGAASDTTISRVSAGVVAVEGVNVLTTGTGRGQGKETIWIPASAMWARTTNGPGAASRELTTNGDVMIKGWAFDTTTEEAVQFYLGMPKSWNKGTITFQAYWTNASGASTETVSWGLSVGAYTDSDAIDSTELGTEVRVSDTWLAQNDIHVSAESGAVTVGNTPIDDDMLIGQIARSVSNDNMTGDAELLGIKIFFTTSAATDA